MTRRSIRCLAAGMGAQIAGALFLAGAIPHGGGLMTHWPVPILFAFAAAALVLTVVTFRASAWAAERFYSVITLVLVAASVGLGALSYWRIFAS